MFLHNDLLRNTKLNNIFNQSDPNLLVVATLADDRPIAASLARPVSTLYQRQTNSYLFITTVSNYKNNYYGHIFLIPGQVKGTIGAQKRKHLSIL